MSDGVRFVTIPRNNPVNAITMGGLERGLNAGGVQEIAVTHIEDFPTGGHGAPIPKLRIPCADSRCCELK